MKKRQMERWVKALRSGKFKQGKGALCSDNKYCCLGVLCEINKRHVSKEESGGLVRYEYSQTVLPSRIKSYVGVWSDVGSFRDSKAENIIPSCATMNDCDARSFTEIADIIEQNYKRL